jgi:hypothetical protein
MKFALAPCGKFNATLFSGSNTGNDDTKGLHKQMIFTGTKRLARCHKMPGRFKEIGFEEVEDEPDWASSPEQVSTACLTATLTNQTKCQYCAC